jgi:hypothetical protein
MEMKTKLFITVLVFMTATILTRAQNQGTDTKQPLTPQRGYAWVDANNDGICDFYQRPGPNNRSGRGMGMAPGQGNRRGMAASQGRGLGPAPAKGYGRGLGPGQGRGQAPGGRFFIDEDKNGVCDYFEKSEKKQ